MEIEAKFFVPDGETFNRLNQIDRILDLVLLPGKTRRVRDTYLDTPDRRLLAAGYALRRREQDDGVLMTVKGLAADPGAVHRREEYEVLLPVASAPLGAPGSPPQSADSPADWGDNPVRNLVLDIIGDQPSSVGNQPSPVGKLLAPLFHLDQTRTVRSVRCGEQEIAEWSQDQVQIDAGMKSIAFMELEVELKQPEAEGDLARLSTWLEDECHLSPDPRSKFERALALLEGLLTSDERRECERIAALGNVPSRRARALLALDEGASYVQAAQRAGFSVRRVRYWRKQFQQRRIGILAPHPPAPVAPAPDAPAVPPQSAESPVAPASLAVGSLTLAPGDSMAEAARKVFALHLHRMLEREPGTRAGEDIEELHHMRVAVRRLRAAWQVFQPYIDERDYKPFAKTLRRTGRVLGAVRDLDIARDKTARYIESLPPERRGELDALVAAREAEYARARNEMIAHLDSAAFRDWKQEFAAFLETPDAADASGVAGGGTPVPYRVHHVLPVILQQAYARVRAFDEVLAAPNVPLSTLHQLRITGKYLRYTLEFFHDVLPPEAGALVKAVTHMQDHLGELQDAVVASAVLRDFLTWGTWPPPPKATSYPSQVFVAPGVAAYLTYQQNQIQELVRTFPPQWAGITGPEFRHQLAAIVAAL